MHRTFLICDFKAALELKFFTYYLKKTRENELKIYNHSILSYLLVSNTFWIVYQWNSSSEDFRSDFQRITYKLVGTQQHTAKSSVWL